MWLLSVKGKPCNKDGGSCVHFVRVKKVVVFLSFCDDETVREMGAAGVYVYGVEKMLFRVFC